MTSRRTILLIRHGEPDVDWLVRLSRSEFYRWTASYDTAPLLSGSSPPASTREKVDSDDIVLVSELRRSQESSAVLYPDQPVKFTHIEFNELPLIDPPLPWLKFTPFWWVVIARALRFAGYGRHQSGRGGSRIRASVACGLLCQYASPGQRAVLIGHGAMNRMIGDELARRGWHRDRRLRRWPYWGVEEFYREVSAAEIIHETN